LSAERFIKKEGPVDGISGVQISNRTKTGEQGGVNGTKWVVKGGGGGRGGYKIRTIGIKTDSEEREDKNTIAQGDKDKSQGKGRT